MEHSHITLGWLDSAISSHLFRPALKSSSEADPFHLGWELIEPTRDWAISCDIRESVSASAEAVASLAAANEAAHALGRTRVGISAEKGTPTSYLELAQISTNQWKDPFRDVDSSGTRAGIDPLRRWTLASVEDARIIAQFISRRVSSILRAHSYDDSAIQTAIDIIAHEALLNVFQHAYPIRPCNSAFSAVTLLDSAIIAESTAILSSAEQQWLKTAHGLVIEISIADCGLGIPATLWQAYSSRFPLEFGKRSRAIREFGRKDAKRSRALLHQEITEWALEYDSTRKSPEDFGGDIARLNWRGLHRAANIVADVDGSIILRTGQARAGRVFEPTAAGHIEIRPTRRINELPGTTVTIRIPFPPPIPKHVRLTASVSQQRAALNPAVVVPEAKARDVLRGITGPATLVNVCHPFTTLMPGDCGRFLDLVRSIPPNCVQCHGFLDISDELVLTQLHAFHNNDDLSLPRLICFWTPGSVPKWKFAGLIRSSARILIDKLENGESVTFDLDNTHFAEDLHRAYSPFLLREGQRLRLDVWGAVLSEEEINNSLQISFDSYVTQKGSWFQDEQDVLIRLRSGKLVRRYVNVSELLQSNDMLARAVGRKLAITLNLLSSQHSILRIVTDSEGSYFLLRHLLSDQMVPPLLRFDQSDRDGATCIGFVDALHRGATVARLSSQEKNLLCSICAVDLRVFEQRETLPRVTTLLNLPFDPIEVREVDAHGAKTILEIDQITLEPCTPVDLNRFELGTDQAVTDFIRSHAEYFRYGVHRRGGRVQIVSPAVGALVGTEQDFLVDSITQRILTVAKRYWGKEWKATDVVIFCRADAQVRLLVPALASRLSELFAGVVYSSTLATAPSNSRQVFARVDPAQNFLADLQIAGKQPQLALNQPSSYVALFLDDAAVTGKGLLNFVIRASEARNEQRPDVVLAIPVVTRLSPSEEYLYAHILQSLGQEIHLKDIRFSFLPLLRLCIKSHMDVESTSIYRYVRGIESQALVANPRLRTYLTDVLARIENFGRESEQHAHERPVCSHPFYPKTVERFTASIRTIWIRALIALYEQNVAVLGALLHEIREACRAGDTTLFAMFSLEPDLCSLRPIKRCCANDIRDFALIVLEDPSSSPAIKSDALIALFFEDMPEDRFLIRSVVAVWRDPDLLCQFLLLMIINGLRRSDAISRVAKEMHSLIGDRETQSFVVASLRTFAEYRAQGPFQSLDAAIDAFVNAMSHTIFHSPGDHVLNGPTRWIQSPPQSRADQPVSDLHETFIPAIECVRDFIVPALQGLEKISVEHGHGTLAQQCRHGWTGVIYLINELEAYLSSLESATLEPEHVERLEILWTEIKKHTQFGPPQTYLGKRLLKEESSGILEQVAPTFYCLPLNVANNVARRWDGVRITADWQEIAGHSVEAVLVQSALADIAELVDLLLDDAMKHGTGEAIMRFYAMSQQDRQLRMVIENRVSSVPSRGNGKSQQRVRELAEKNGWYVQFPETANPGDNYEVAVLLGRAFALGGE
jgi:hypothetical protein